MGADRIASAYKKARGWEYITFSATGIMDIGWLADDGGTPLSSQYDPTHNLVAIIGLYVAGGNTWDLVNNRTTTIDRDFVEGFRWAYFSYNFSHGQ